MILRTTLFPALLGLVIAVSASSEQQRHVGNHQETPEQTELANAQKAEAEAKAEYYRQLTNKLRQPEPSQVHGNYGTALSRIRLVLVL